MDALALLCNLYGEGPATLKRLRAGGVSSIEELGAKPAAEVAAILALAPASARRFLKEATVLRVRVQSGGLADEQPRAQQRLVREGARGKQAILDAAARRWDELERTAQPEPDVAPARGASELAVRATPLARCDLDDATRAALESIGMRSLEALARAPAEGLAEEAGLGLSQILFAQSLARRKLRDDPADSAIAEEDLRIHELRPPERDAPRFSPSELPPRAWLSRGSATQGEMQLGDEGAGPFA